MSFFKSLLLAIFATLFLTYVLGVGMFELLDVNIHMDSAVIEPFQAISVAALVSVAMVLAGLAIVLSVFGSIIFLGLIIAGAITMALVGVFWPVLLVAVAIWLLTKQQPNEKSASY